MKAILKKIWNGIKAVGRWLIKPFRRQKVIVVGPAPTTVEDPFPNLTPEMKKMAEDMVRKGVVFPFLTPDG